MDHAARYALALGVAVRRVTEKGDDPRSSIALAAHALGVEPDTLFGMYEFAEQRAEGAARVAIRKARQVA